MIHEQMETIEREQILTFHEEGDVNRMNDNTTTRPELSKLNDLGDVLDNDVIGFLQRPILEKEFAWLASQPDAVQLFDISLPANWLSHKMIQEKLAGFRYFKSDFKIRVQINAQPFNAGLLLLTFIPLDEQNQETPSSMNSFSGLTGYKHVLLDLSQDTSCELTVPYSAIVSHNDLINGYGYMGTVRLYVYSPLTGLDDVDGTVWITAENIEVALPTGLPLKEPVVSGPAHSGETRVDTKMKGTSAPPTVKDKKVKLVLPSEPEKGTVEKIANTVKDVAGVVKMIPEIGPVAAAVEWVAGAVSSVASFFGWSKPADNALPAKQTLVVANNFANYDGDSKVKSLAFSWANETQIPTDVFKSDVDEMSFSHILARPVYLTRFNMTKVDPQSALLWKWPVDPLACVKEIKDDQSKTPYIPFFYVAVNTYLSYLSSFFKFYRGSINYHFKIVKTVYHSGRIRVFVVPGATVDTDVNTIDMNKVHSIVYDIRDTNEFDVCVPYKWNAPWKALSGAFGNAATAPQNLTPNEPTAMIYVVVVNSLRNPSTAADTIQFVVETSAGPDFQFACPALPEKVQLITTEQQLNKDYPAKTAYGPAHSAECILDDAAGDQLTANKIAIGEVITGWRALLKRYSRWLLPTAAGNKFILFPYNSALQTPVTDAFDLYAAAEILYRFMSGGIRIGAKSKVVAQQAEVIVHEIEPHDSAKAQEDTSGAVLQSETLEPLVELGIPFYQETPAIPTNLGKPKFSYPSQKGTNYRLMPYNTGSLIRSSKEMQIWRSTAEDFSFGYLIGPPQTLFPFVPDSTPCLGNWQNFLNSRRIVISNVVKGFAGADDPMDRQTAITQGDTLLTDTFKTITYDKTFPVLNETITEFNTTMAEILKSETSKEQAIEISGKAVKKALDEFANFFRNTCILP